MQKAMPYKTVLAVSMVLEFYEGERKEENRRKQKIQCNHVDMNKC